METIEVNNNTKTESQYVETVDIKSMSACDFSDKKNPVTGEKCSEGFTNKTNSSKKTPKDKSKLPNDKLVQIFYASMGILGLYILFRLLQKSKMK